MAACGTCPKCESMLVFFGTQIVLFTAKKKFIVAKTIAEKAVTANIIPQSRIYSKKILEYLSKNHYTTVLNLFLRTDRFLQIFNFSIPSCTSWPTNSSSNVSTSCHSSNQPFSNGPTLTVPVGTGKSSTKQNILSKQ